MIRFLFRTLLAWTLVLSLLAPGPAFSAEVLDSGTMLAKAAKLFDQGQFLDAVELYQTIYKKGETPAHRAQALVRIADVTAVFLGQKNKALSLYQRAIRAFPGQPALQKAYFNSGVLYLEKKDYPAAKANFLALIKHFPHSAKAQRVKSVIAEIEERMAGRSSGGEIVSSARKRFHGEPDVRVLLGTVTKARVQLSEKGSLKAERGTFLLPKGTYTVEARNGRLYLRSRDLGERAVFDPGGGALGFRGKAYGGEMHLNATRTKLRVVNHVPMETYLRGVVPSEMPSTWNPEALKAQAVAARSYAYVTAQTARSRSWDLTATATSQVYGGLSAANARTDKAIAATTGQVITWEDEPALAYYHSHSGGMLEDDASVWGADLPFYKVQKDDASRHEKEMSWSYSVSGDAVARACRKNGYAVRWVADIAPGEISGSGRVTSFVLKTDKGDITVKANALRNWINPTRIKSLLCRVRRKGNNDFVFYGRGWGHGVGLSQYGASRLAKTGRKHQQILAAYYPGTKVGKMY